MDKVLAKGSVHKFEHPVVKKLKTMAHGLGLKNVHIGHISPDEDHPHHSVEIFHEGEFTPAHEKLHNAAQHMPELEHEYGDSGGGEHKQVLKIKPKLHKSDGEKMVISPNGQWSLQ